MKRWLLPSVLSADFAHLAASVQAVAAAGADMFHIDVMDGHFVPNLTMGPGIARTVASLTDLGLDVHLMVARPEDWVEPFIKAGARAVSFHVEATPHCHRLLTRIRELGARAGLALNPGTPVSCLEAALEFADYVLVMTVNPGFPGQTFIPAGLEKIRLLRSLAEARGYEFAIEVDGGIKEHNIHEARDAGAHWFVVGSGIFRAADPAAMTRRLKEILNA